MTEKEPTAYEVLDFFDMYGDAVVFPHAIGGVLTEVTVEELFQMFLGRMRHLNERYDGGNT